MRKAPPGGVSAVYRLFRELGLDALRNVPEKRRQTGHFRDFESYMPPGSAAPDFTLKGPDGREVSLSDFQGQYVVLEFGAYT